MGLSRCKALLACLFLVPCLIRHCMINSSSSLTIMDAVRTTTTTTTTTTGPNPQQAQQIVTTTKTIRPELPPFPWQWIHPMKTGTSFGNMLYMLSCPEDYRANWTNDEITRHSIAKHGGIPEASPACKQKWTHGTTFNYMVNMARPLRPQWWLGEHAFRNADLTDPQLFMTFRDPVDRIISMVLRYNPNSNFTSSEQMADMITSHKYLHKPLLGKHMTSFFFTKPDFAALDGRHAQQACNVIQNMTWVGLTEHFSQSACLLHAMFDFPQHPAETANVRPTAWRNGALNTTHVGVLVRQKVRLLDDVVYQCAKKKFQQDLAKWAPGCR